MNVTVEVRKYRGVGETKCDKVVVWSGEREKQKRVYLRLTGTT